MPKYYILPTLCIQFGMMKIFAKVMNEDVDGFKYSRQVLPKIGDSKSKKSIFIRPQIRKMLGDVNFTNKLTRQELRACVTRD